ncbi:hypothetical protein VPNG_09981 [Cytospora leucostoma]|uniref:Uncharacterized protein n=1 Tax=Cytospora leucostoma TaxID=1230097 RepID=A0A423VKC2_9PEZI|nr:hypothetical protein VPNG_09981 [Cytospora leucostoma]
MSSSSSSRQLGSETTVDYGKENRRDHNYGSSVPEYPSPLNSGMQSEPTGHGAPMSNDFAAYNSEGNYRIQHVVPTSSKAAKEEEREDRREAFMDKVEDEATGKTSFARKRTYKWSHQQATYPTVGPSQVATPPSTYLHSSSASVSKVSRSGSSGGRAGPSRYAGGAFVVGQPTQQFGVDDSLATMGYTEQPETQYMMTAAEAAYMPSTGVLEDDYVDNTAQVIPPQEAAASSGSRDHGPHVHGSSGHGSHGHHRSHRHRHSREHRSR